MSFPRFVPDAKTFLAERAMLRTQINALMTTATSLRELFGLPLPGDMHEKILALEDDAWKHLRASLAAYYENDK